MFLIFCVCRKKKKKRSLICFSALAKGVAILDDRFANLAKAAAIAQFYSWSVLRYIFRSYWPTVSSFREKLALLFEHGENTVFSQSARSSLGTARAVGANKFSRKRETQYEEASETAPRYRCWSHRFLCARAMHLSFRRWLSALLLPLPPAALAAGPGRLLFRKPGNNQINAIHEFPMRRT